MIISTKFFETYHLHIDATNYWWLFFMLFQFPVSSFEGPLSIMTIMVSVNTESAYMYYRTIMYCIVFCVNSQCLGLELMSYWPAITLRIWCVQRIFVDSESHNNIATYYDCVGSRTVWKATRARQGGLWICWLWKWWDHMKWYTCRHHNCNCFCLLISIVQMIYD